jgi:hypothetical protein
MTNLQTLPKSALRREMLASTKWAS